MEVDFYRQDYVISSTQISFQLLEDLFIKMQNDESLKSNFLLKIQRCYFTKYWIISLACFLIDRFGQIDNIDRQIFNIHSKHIQSKFIFGENNDFTQESFSFANHT